MHIKDRSLSTHTHRRRSWSQSWRSRWEKCLWANTSNTWCVCMCFCVVCFVCALVSPYLGCRIWLFLICSSFPVRSVGEFDLICFCSWCVRSPLVPVVVVSIMSPIRVCFISLTFLFGCSRIASFRTISFHNQHCKFRLVSVVSFASACLASYDAAWFCFCLFVNVAHCSITRANLALFTCVSFFSLGVPSVLGLLLLLLFSLITHAGYCDWHPSAAVQTRCQQRRCTFVQQTNTTTQQHNHTHTHVHSHTHRTVKAAAQWHRAEQPVCVCVYGCVCVCWPFVLVCSQCTITCWASQRSCASTSATSAESRVLMYVVFFCAPFMLRLCFSVRAVLSISVLALVCLRFGMSIVL